jgi:hypothetical protein
MVTDKSSAALSCGAEETQHRIIMRCSGGNRAPRFHAALGEICHEQVIVATQGIWEESTLGLPQKWPVHIRMDPAGSGWFDSQQSPVRCSMRNQDRFVHV